MKDANKNVGEPSVTVVIVPRERFSLAAASLEDVLNNTPHWAPIVYVEGNPPHKVRTALHDVGKNRVHFISTDTYLPPNKARNLGFADVKTRYVIFLDNDVWVEPGWLEALVACADETGADVVGPLYRQGRREDREIHMAGGMAHITESNGRRRIRTSHDFQGKPLDEILPQLSRCKTELAEFHGVLIATSTLNEIGGLDEKLLCTREHIDFCMTVRARGGKVMLEPASQVTYTRPPPFAWSDLGFFSLRWSEDWTQRTLDHFFEKWDLDRKQIPHLMTWCKKQRYRFLDPWYSNTTRFLAQHIGKERMVNILRYTLYPIEGALNRLLTNGLRSGRKD